MHFTVKNYIKGLNFCLLFLLAMLFGVNTTNNLLAYRCF